MDASSRRHHSANVRGQGRKITEERSMKEVTIIGIDLAKSVFQVHGAAVDGSTVFRKKLTRLQFVRFMAEQPACLVAMEACGSAHYWGREMKKLGHDCSDLRQAIRQTAKERCR